MLNTQQRLNARAPRGDWVTPSEAWWGLLLVSPVVVLVILLKFMPAFLAGWFSLTDYPLLSSPRFIGFENFVRLFNDPIAVNSFRVTIIYTIGSVLPATVLSLAIAVMLDKKLRGMAFYRTVFFLPQVASWVALGVIWLYLLNPAFGPLNWLLHQVGLPRQDFLSSPSQALPTLMGIGIWRQLGYSVVIFLAGLQGIPQHLHEAAMMDGASAWRRFRQVTLPMLKPTTMFVIVTATIFSLQIFDQVMVLTQGGPGRRTYTTVLFVYEQAFRSQRMGYASAVALMLFAVILALSLIVLWSTGQLKPKQQV